MKPGALPPAPASDTGPRGVTASRVAAADILADLRSGDLLDGAFDRRTRALDARDRRWVQELVYGLLRRRSRLDAALAPRVRGGLARLDPDLVDLLRLGVNQLLWMGSVPPYAAIAQTVELAKARGGMGAARLANAVLRRVDRERASLADAVPTGDDVLQLAEAHSHPAWMVARWVARWGLAPTARLLAHDNEEAPVILRPYGTARAQLEEALAQSGVSVTEVPLVPDSLRLATPAVLPALGPFRQGHCFVQDPAATLVARYVAPDPDAVVADLCAAPGGKALELSRRAARVIAADRSPHRLARLTENVHRLDARAVCPLVMDALHPAIAPVDAVLLDAPCTGTGTFRRHPDARWRLRVSDLAVLGALQRDLLSSAATLVRRGGLLTYATCSLELEENDAQVETFLARHRDFRLAPPPRGTVPDDVLDGDVLRVLPQRHGVDGAFAARFRRAA